MKSAFLWSPWVRSMAPSCWARRANSRTRGSGVESARLEIASRAAATRIRGGDSRGTVVDSDRCRAQLRIHCRASMSRASHARLRASGPSSRRARSTHAGDACQRISGRTRLTSKGARVTTCSCTVCAARFACRSHRTCAPINGVLTSTSSLADRPRESGSLSLEQTCFLFEKVSCE
jgi:hypothetical protein